MTYEVHTKTEKRNLESIIIIYIELVYFWVNVLSLISISVTYGCLLHSKWLGWGGEGESDGMSQSPRLSLLNLWLMNKNKTQSTKRVSSAWYLTKAHGILPRRMVSYQGAMQKGKMPIRQLFLFKWYHCYWKIVHSYLFRPYAERSIYSDRGRRGFSFGQHCQLKHDIILIPGVST